MLRASAGDGRTVTSIESKIATIAFCKLSPLLGLSFKVQRIASAITLYAEILVILHCTISDKPHIKNVEVAIAISISDRREVVKLKLDVYL